MSQLNPELLEGVVAYVARKYHLSWQDTDDLRSALWVKVLDRDGIVLRRFAGRSTLFTYLVRVASRLILDNYTARYGRWRPSAKVRRLGPAAVEWARMIERDGWSPEHARAAVGAKGTRESASRTVGFPDQAMTRRYRARRFIELTEVTTLATSDRAFNIPADGPLGLVTAKRQVKSALRAALRALTADERRLLLLRYPHGQRISDIARRERCRPAALYRRYARILKKMRQVIGAAGVSAESVNCAFETPPAITSSLEGSPYSVRQP